MLLSGEMLEGGTEYIKIDVEVEYEVDESLKLIGKRSGSFPACDSII